MNKSWPEIPEDFVKRAATMQPTREQHDKFIDFFIKSNKKALQKLAGATGCWWRIKSLFG